jgi:tight adherence protein B
MSGFIIIIAVGVAVASLLAFAVTVFMPTEETSAMDDRLAAMASGRRGSAQSVKADQPSLLMTGGFDDKANAIQMLLNRMPALHDYLEQAGTKLTSMQFAAICVGAFAFGCIACFISPIPVLLAPIFGAMLAGVPVAWLMFTRSRRLARFGRQMPEALELLGRSLRAGHSLAAGFGLVGSEMDEPLAPEFKRAFEEQNLGIPLDQAIEQMAKRVPNMDLRFFATAVILQRQTGGDLAEILDKISHIVRERLQILGQIQALTGEGRMSGAVLLALPPVLFLVMLKMNYEYVMMLFTDELGRYLLCAALVSQVLGAIVIKKIITIRV